MSIEKWFRGELDAIRGTFEFRLERVLFQVAEEISRLMHEQNMSRAEIAERLGVSRAYVTKILNGNPNLTIKTMLRLAEALGRELAIQFAPNVAMQEATVPQIETGALRKLMRGEYAAVSPSVPVEEEENGLPFAA